MIGPTGLSQSERLTFGDHPLQADDVLVGELAHDAGLAQEVLPLLLRVAGLQRLDGHSHVSPARRLHHPAEHLPELSYGPGGREYYSLCPETFGETAMKRGTHRKAVVLTRADDFLLGNGAGMDLRGKLEDGDVGILVHVWVHVGLQRLQLI